MGGVIRRVDKGPSDPFVARTRMQVLNICNSVFSQKTERDKFDNAYEPIRANLQQCKAACDDIRTLWNRFIVDLQDPEIARFDEQTKATYVDKPIDDDLERKIKEFFNRGKNAVEQLKNLDSCTGLLFDKLNKKTEVFAKEKDRILKSKTGEERQWYEKVFGFVESERNGWLSRFTETRNSIEHHGWHLRQIEYELTSDGHIMPVMPEIEGERLDLLLNAYWECLFNFCETMVVRVALGRQVKFPRILREIAPQDRDPACPVRYCIDVNDRARN